MTKLKVSQPRNTKSAGSQKKKSKKRLNIYEAIFIGVIGIFIYAPIISMIVFSFNEPKDRVSSTNVWNEFGFSNYVKLFNDRTIQTVVVNTLVVAVLATIISVIIGTLAAVSISRQKKVFRNMVLSINNIPVVTPDIITGISLLLLFLSVGFRDGFTSMLLAHVAFCVPFVIVTVYPKLKSLDVNLIDAASDLGATPLQALVKIIVPQLKVAMVAAAVISFTLSFDDFIISYFVGGTFQNISVFIYSSRSGGSKPVINALSTIILAFISIKVFFDFLKAKKQAKFEDND